jgi:hypothetical protein
MYRVSTSVIVCPWLSANAWSLAKYEGFNLSRSILVFVSFTSTSKRSNQNCGHYLPMYQKVRKYLKSPEIALTQV